MKALKRLLAAAMTINILSNYSSVLMVMAEDGEEVLEPETVEVTEAPEAEETYEPVAEEPAEVYEEPVQESEEVTEEVPVSEEEAAEAPAETSEDEAPADTAEPEAPETEENAPEAAALTFEAGAYGYVVQTNAEAVTDADKRETKIEQKITDVGEFVTVWAIPADGYEVDYWELNGQRYAETERTKVEAYEIALDQDYRYTVHFRKKAVVVEEEAKNYSETPAESTEASEPMAFTASSDNNVYVTVNAPAGAFPAGTTMKVTAVPEEQVFDVVNEAVEGEVKKLKAVDITFYDADGNEIEPAMPVQVSMKAFNMTSNAENQSVVHVDNDNNATVVADATSRGTTATAEFETEGFSIYVVVEMGVDARLYVNFVQAGNEEVQMSVTSAQVNNIEQYIYDPSAGTLEENVIFKGWTTDKNYTISTDGKSIAEVREDAENKLNESGFVDGTEITYYAMLFKSYNVAYRDELGVTVKTDQVIYRADSPETEHKYTVNLPYTPYVNTDDSEDDGSTAEFMGWDLLNPETGAVEATYENGKEITVSSDILLKADVKKGNWLSFDENLRSATYTQPQFIIGTDTPTEPETPTRTGYTFVGWYTEDASAERDGTTAGEPFDFSKQLTKNTTVYGKWTQNTTASYSVVIWQQNLTEDGYDFVKSVTINNASVGSTANAVSQQGTGDSAYARINNQNYQYPGFHLDHYDQNVTVTAEGNAVVNVYYNRTEYTLTFKDENGRNTIKEIKAKYGQDISENFPIKGTDGRTYDQGERWNPQDDTVWKVVMVLISTMPDRNVTFHLDKANRPLKTMYYYVEALPGESGDTISYDGTTYVLKNTISARYNGVTEEDFLELDGFDKNVATDLNGRRLTKNDNGFYIYSESRNQSIRFLYKRKTYSIIYRDGVYVDGENNPIKEDKLPDSDFTNETNIKFEASISNKGEYTPERNGYVFLGWYADDTCETEYSFDKMPSHNVTVYAKWVSREYNVVLHPNDSDADKIEYANKEQKESFYVDYNEKVGNVGGERTTCDLVGWYTDETLKHAFDFDAFVINDDYIKNYGNPEYREEGWPSVVGQLNLYAKWRSKLDGANGIYVEYDPNNKQDIIVDDHTYTDSAEAVAISAAKSAESNKVFSHWVLQTYKDGSFVDTETKVFPGDTFVVKLSDAREEDITPTEENPDTKKYTVRLRAEYIEKEAPTPTHINWYDNYTGNTYRKDSELEVNKSVAVYGYDEKTGTVTAPERAGYAFKGWVRDIENTSGKTTSETLFVTYDAEKKAYNHNYVAADEEWATDSDQYHAMYALWEPNKYTVKYDKNAEDATGTMADQVFEYDEEKALTALGFTYTDYKFVGWNTKADGSGTSYADKAAVKNLTTEDGGIVTLYAQWELDVAPYTIHHYLKGTTTQVQDDVTGTQTIGKTVKATPATEYQGKTVTADSYDPSQEIIIDRDKDKNVITVYYTLPITITAKTSSKMYDGKPLNGEYTIDGALPADEAAIKEALGTAPSITDVGTKQYLTAEDQAKITGIPTYYTVTYTPGTLTVTPVTDKVTVTITENSGAEKYDGKEKIVTGYEVTNISNSLYKEADFTFNGNATVKGTDAGTYNMELKPADFTNNNTNFSNVEFVIVDGTLEISKRTVTLTSADGEKVYDGKPLTKNAQTDVTVGGEGFAEGEGATYNITGTQTEVGESKNTFTYTLNTNTQDKNYTITQTEGTLKVTELTDKVTVTITENSGTEKYDGEEKTVTGYKVTNISNSLYTETDFTFNGNDTVKGTDAGTYNMELKPADFTNNNTNFSNVEFVIVDGTLEISKRDVTLTSATDSKVYDGNALTNDEVTVGGDGFAEGEGATYDVTGTQTVVGSSNNTFSYKLNEGTKAENYEITTAEGTLTVTSRDAKYEITVEANSAEAQYDGKEHTAAGFKTLEFTVNGNKYTVEGLKTEDPSKKDAGEYTNNITGTAVVKDAAGNDVSGEFAVKTVNGSLTITKREVTLTSATDSKVYDGKALTNDEVTVGGDGFAEGDGATYDVTGTQTLVGSSDNTFTYKLNEGTKADNYIITTTEGTLTVTDGSDPGDTPVDPELVVTKTAGEGPYGLGAEVTFTITATNIYAEAQTITLSEIDGVTLAQDKFANVAGGATVETTATYTITEADILASEFKNTVTANMGNIEKTAEATVITDEAEASLKLTKTAEKETYKYGDTIKYTIVVENTGNLTVKDINVTDELTDTVVPADKFTLAPGASKTLTAEYTVTPDDAKAGKVVNTAKAVGTASDNSSVEATGDVTVVAGKVDITITADSAKKVYDGTALTKDGWELTSGELVVGDKIESVTVTGSQTLVGSSDNVPSGAKIVRQPKRSFFLFAVKEGDDVTEGYNITYANGTLTVTDGSDPGEEPVDPELVVTKTVEKDSGYDLGDEVTFTITATNIYAEAQTISLSEIEGVTLEKDTFENVPAGETITTTATYTITETDILAGEFKNTVTAKMGNIEKTAEATVNTVEKNPHMTVVKEVTSTPANGASYAKDETVSYKITVTNDGNVTVKDITVNDELTGDSWTVESLKPEESKEFAAKYVVTEADTKNGKVVNVATAEGKDPEDDPTPTDPGTTDVPTVGHMTVVKTVTSKAPEGRTNYRPGETITYEVKVVNDGKVELKNITVKDELTGDSWTVESLNPGESKTFTAKHVVTEAEGKAGSVKNVATATGEDPDGNEPVITNGDVTSTTEPAPKKQPNTSDHNNSALWMGMMFLSLMGACGALFTRKRFSN